MGGGVCYSSVDLSALTHPVVPGSNTKRNVYFSNNLVSNDILMLVIVLRQRTKVGSTIGAYFKNIIEQYAYLIGCTLQCLFDGN